MASKAVVVQSHGTRYLSGVGQTGLQPANMQPASACWKAFFHEDSGSCIPTCAHSAGIPLLFFFAQGVVKQCGSKCADTRDREESFQRLMINDAMGCSGCPRATRCPRARAPWRTQPAPSPRGFHPAPLPNPPQFGAGVGVRVLSPCPHKSVARTARANTLTVAGATLV